MVDQFYFPVLNSRGKLEYFVANTSILIFITIKCYQYPVVSLTDNFTDSANNFALKARRKTLGAPDIFAALEDMEFEEFIPKLKDYLEGSNLTP